MFATSRTYSKIGSIEPNPGMAAHVASAILRDRSNTIASVTYALTGVFVVFFIARQIMKAIVFRKLALDDFFMLLATVSKFYVY